MKNEINAFPTHRLPIAEFLSVAGYSPFRPIKVSNKARVLELFWDSGFNLLALSSSRVLFYYFRC
jgi:hypothetical protein